MSNKKSIIYLGLTDSGLFLYHINDRKGCNITNPFHTEDSMVDYLKTEARMADGNYAGIQNGLPDSARVFNSIDVSPLPDESFKRILLSAGLEAIASQSSDDTRELRAQTCPI